MCSQPPEIWFIPAEVLNMWTKRPQQIYSFSCHLIATTWDSQVRTAHLNNSLINILYISKPRWVSRVVVLWQDCAPGNIVLTSILSRICSPMTSFFTHLFFIFLILWCYGSHHTIFFTHLKDYYSVLAQTETYEMGTYAGESEVSRMFSGEQCGKYMKILETYLAF